MKEGLYVIVLAGTHQQKALGFRLLGLFRQYDKDRVVFRMADRDNVFLRECKACLQALDMTWQVIKPDPNLSVRAARIDVNERLLLEADQVICLNDSNNIKHLINLADAYGIPVFIMRNKKR